MSIANVGNTSKCQRGGLSPDTLIISEVSIRTHRISATSKTGDMSDKSNPHGLTVPETDKLSIHSNEGAYHILYMAFSIKTRFPVTFQLHCLANPHQPGVTAGAKDILSLALLSTLFGSYL